MKLHCAVRNPYRYTPYHESYKHIRRKGSKQRSYKSDLSSYVYSNARQPLSKHQWAQEERQENVSKTSHSISERQPWHISNNIHEKHCSYITLQLQQTQKHEENTLFISQGSLWDKKKEKKKEEDKNWTWYIHASVVNNTRRSLCKVQVNNTMTYI